jgi:hypothetical protein
MRVLSSISRRHGRLRHGTGSSGRSGNFMMATIRALEPGGRAASAVPPPGIESLFS